MAKTKSKSTSVKTKKYKTMSTKKRNRLSKNSFAIKKGRRYPIHDKKHARNALGRVAQHGTKAEQKTVRRAVTKKYPSLKKTGGSK